MAFEAGRELAIIPGDGIGKEIVDATLEVLGAVGFRAKWVYLHAGMQAIDQGKPAMPPETVEEVRRIGIALKGPTTTPSGKGHSSANVALRRALDLFANVRPTQTLPGLGVFSGEALTLGSARRH